MVFVMLTIEYEILAENMNFWSFSGKQGLIFQKLCNCQGPFLVGIFATVLTIHRVNMESIGVTVFVLLTLRCSILDENMTFLGKQGLIFQKLFDSQGPFLVGIFATVLTVNRVNMKSNGVTVFVLLTLEC